jgi:hypothetical protein
MFLSIYILSIYKYILFFIILFIIFYIIHNHISIKQIEQFNDNVIFLNNYELLNILLNNHDKYYDTFFENDFNARNINNIDEYKDLIKKSVTDFNDNQKNKIKKCIYNADLYFSTLKFKWFDGNKNNKLKWIIGCTKGKLYENGLPHTRNNFIIISDEKVNNYSEEKLIKTLIHEKVHIYQKNYINDIELFLNENNFIKIKEREKSDNIRANPDLDNWIYKDYKQNIYKAVYNNNPSSVEDIQYKPINNQSYEHPYEKMAIYIENKYNL